MYFADKMLYIQRYTDYLILQIDNEEFETTAVLNSESEFFCAGGDINKLITPYTAHWIYWGGCRQLFF